MAGTDCPISLPKVTYTQAIAFYRDHRTSLSPEERVQILSKTVQEVWPFGV